MDLFAVVKEASGDASWLFTVDCCCGEPGWPVGLWRLVPTLKLSKLVAGWNQDTGAVGTR